MRSMPRNQRIRCKNTSGRPADRRKKKEKSWNQEWRWCGRRDLNPQDQWSADFKSAASTDFATSAFAAPRTDPARRCKTVSLLFRHWTNSVQSQAPTVPHLHRTGRFGQRGLSHTRTDFLPRPDAPDLPARADRRRTRPTVKGVCVPSPARLPLRKRRHRRRPHSAGHEA